MKAKAKVCIVVSDYVGMPLVLDQLREGEPPILLGDTVATVFPSARAAKDAIYVSKKYARRYELPWANAKFTIAELDMSLVLKDAIKRNEV